MRDPEGAWGMESVGYERWRGGLRDEGKTGASVAMEVLRRQAQVGFGIGAAGLVAIVLGFVIR